MTVIPALIRLRQEGCKFEASPGYIENSRAAQVKVFLALPRKDPVPKNQNNNNKLNNTQ
jgi:hypothetical protein